MSVKGRWSNPATEWRPLPHMQEFLNELEAQLRARDYIRKMKLGLAHFALFCDDEGIMHPNEITRNTILRFQAKVNQREDWAMSYRQQTMRYVRVWINWLASMNYIDANPWHNIRIKQIQKKPNPLSDDEIIALFEAHRRQAFHSQPFAFHRREVMLAMLYAWGLRAHEMLAINVSHVDLRLDFVTTINKGGGHKSLPYLEPIKQAMRRYLPLRARKAILGEDALLIDGSGTRLSYDMAYRTIVDLGQKAGVQVHPHQLRDTCGTHLLDSDVEVERVMAILGHSNVSQTLAYSRVNNRKVAEAHERAMNPRLDRLLFDNTRFLKEET